MNESEGQNICLFNKDDSVTPFKAIAHEFARQGVKGYKTEKINNF